MKFDIYRRCMVFLRIGLGLVYRERNHFLLVFGIEPGGIGSVVYDT